MNIQTSAGSGFTLIEIMIVVGIIGMLAAIAIPNFTRHREDARRTGCITNIRQIDGAIESWATAMKKDEGAAVTFNDISGYLRGPITCPSGGTSFEDSYSITVVDARPTCLRKPQTHKL